MSSENKTMTPDEAKQFVKDAICYALENQDPDMDYGKYVSKDFINTIDDKTFNFDQWVQHQKNIKAMVRSMKPIFDYMISDGENVALGFQVRSITNDGQEIWVKDMAFMTIKNRKIVYCDELTRLIKGDEKHENFASMS